MVEKKDVCKSNKTSKNFKRIFKLFEGCKYKWGGKSFDGIDCSALLHMFYQFNNKFYPTGDIDNDFIQLEKKVNDVVMRNTI